MCKQLNELRTYHDWIDELVRLNATLYLTTQIVRFDSPELILQQRRIRDLFADTAGINEAISELAKLAEFKLAERDKAALTAIMGRPL
jgi:hypothetical protein